MLLNRPIIQQKNPSDLLVCGLWVEHENDLVRARKFAHYCILNIPGAPHKTIYDILSEENKEDLYLIEKFIQRKVPEKALEGIRCQMDIDDDPETFQDCLDEIIWSAASTDIEIVIEQVSGLCLDFADEIGLLYDGVRIQQNGLRQLFNTY